MSKESNHFEQELEFQDTHLARELFGPQEKYLDLVRNVLHIDISARGTTIRLSSEQHAPVQIAANFFVQVYDLLRSGHSLHGRDMEHALNFLLRDPEADLKTLFEEKIFAVSTKKTITPKTLTQRDYLQSIREKPLVFGIGPAGTGKTYLAVAMAVSALLQKKVQRLILTRPALEAGEKLGFLPGDILEKINPYLRPLYDALHDMLDFRKVQEMQESGIIEVAPLAFMRGRTLNNAFIILDEAQNTTPEQMKMFLTRMGFGSKAIVTGDITQIDLPESTTSGLIQATEILSAIDDVRFIHFDKRDVIRHELVGKIIQAYEEHDERGASSRRKPFS